MTCTAGQCVRPVFARGLCQMHHRRLLRHGTTEKKGDFPKSVSLSLAEHFWGKVDKSAGEDGCWPYLGFTGKYGHGQHWIARKRYQAHRVAWELTNGPIPEDPPDLEVLHSCDNGSCCNPRHLFTGTQLDNVRDMDTKGRRVNKPSYGAANGNSRAARLRRQRERIAA